MVPLQAPAAHCTHELFELANARLAQAQRRAARRDSAAAAVAAAAVLHLYSRGTSLPSSGGASDADGGEDDDVSTGLDDASLVKEYLREFRASDGGNTQPSPPSVSTALSELLAGMPPAEQAGPALAAATALASGMLGLTGACMQLCVPIGDAIDAAAIRISPARRMLAGGLAPGGEGEVISSPFGEVRRRGEEAHAERAKRRTADGDGEAEEGGKGVERPLFVADLGLEGVAAALKNGAGLEELLRPR